MIEEDQQMGAAMPNRSELVRSYARFLGLTAINPTTIIYLAAVMVGLA